LGGPRLNVRASSTGGPADLSPTFGAPLRQPNGSSINIKKIFLGALTSRRYGVSIVPFMRRR
ncbi:MAG: hypothetical protein ABJA82_09540, partial [Myxococcales bacterium]